MMRDEHMRAARAAEVRSAWREAEEHWKLAGEREQASACRLIAETTELGDAWRAAGCPEPFREWALRYIREHGFEIAKPVLPENG